jgi:glycosyltransferase involved in cell wall biosynthesis
MTYGDLVPSNALARLVLLVPVWQPEEGFPALVASVVAEGFGAVVIVDDGSDARCSAVFEEVALLPRVAVLRHAMNWGKGRALKTGMEYVLTELREMDGVVTADADGQHRPADMVRVARGLREELEAGGGRLVLGARGCPAEMPWRSRFGNGLTRRVFALVTGVRLADTQTGLRGFPRALLPELLALEGERYEYEMTVLAHICRMGDMPLEVPIETVYLKGNRCSHFDPILDSVRVYSVLLRFSVSALLAEAVVRLFPRRLLRERP